MNAPVLILGAGGLFLIWRALSPDTPGRAPVKTPAAGGQFSRVMVPELTDLSGPIGISEGHTLTLTTPMVMYRGPETDAYTYASIQQLQGGRWVTVYGSGVAGIHIGGSSEPEAWPLVALDQPQPDWCGGGEGARLCLVSFPGPGPTPICGAPPRPGPATLLIEIYERASPADGADGFAAPTCNPRRPVLRAEYPGVIRFEQDWA